MTDPFDVLCSVYTDAHDNYGRFVDMETGEIIQQMTIREFCLTDRWKPVVEKLRAMVAQYGEKEAKARDDYRQTKTLLPGATLSGLFELREVWNEKYQRYENVSRRQAHLQQHTGFLCIDIDHQDNQSLADMKVILRTLRHRPEVALLMKSCSGTGYFALIPLAYPQYHRQQFAALIREYGALGITLDRKCADTTRIRFASYDDKPYININAIPYSGVDLGEQMLAPKAAVYTQRIETDDDLINKVERLVQKLELTHTDITNDYDVWIRLGMSLATLPEPWGSKFFHRVSAISSKYNATDCQRKFDYNNNPTTITINYFFARCKEVGITLR